MSIELIDRNRQIYIQKVIERRSYKEIAKEFGISETRVRQILDQERSRRNNYIYPPSNYIEPIEIACDEFGATKTTRGRIYTALERNGYLKRSKWRRLSEQDIVNMRGIGELCKNIIFRAQNLIINNP